MIVYNLCCRNGHPFEGWFKSPADFENQRDRGLVECPICGVREVRRLLHAPHLKLGAAEGESSQLDPEALEEAQHYRRMFAAMAEFAAKVRAHTENVGDRFAEEARAMHYGEKPHRGIRGRADPQTAAELREEGIEFHTLPFPVDWPNLN
ncbi:MAG: DUF1178 family protein [Casimicrobiaceae bacterium]|nr:DUF1178 family protein [Casimicrobiaceae bacterium]MCX8098194.1 DUF1178 family protein [Casimicrobiaceae bacterium]MDW8313153.1 DUF1178 family protein [Burkholderiales bacterium]